MIVQKHNIFLKMSYFCGDLYIDSGSQQPVQRFFRGSSNVGNRAFICTIFKNKLVQKYHKELDVASIEFFLFAGQRYFIFSEKPSRLFFLAKKTTPIYIGVIWGF
jgi:hypothetical protein